MSHLKSGSFLTMALSTCMRSRSFSGDSGKSLLIKYAVDITLSVPVNGNLNDPSALDVESLQKWSVENKMKLNPKNTWEMVVKGRRSKVLPEPLSGLERKPQLKLLGVTFSTDSCK